MSTNYGSGNGPDSNDRTTAGPGDAPTGSGDARTDSSEYGNPTEPIRDESADASGNDNPTEPIRGSYPTAPIGSGNPASSSATDNYATANYGTAGGAAVANPNNGDWDDSGDTSTPRRRARVGTIVWGLILTALAIILVLAEASSITLNTSQVVIGLLIGAGLALVIGGLVSAPNRQKDDKHQ